MKKIILFWALFIATGNMQLFPQPNAGINAFLVTVAPGTETYSIYGHSAVRIVDPALQSDSVYNWGVFDFSTPNFAWKFAKGRLDYMLDVCSLRSFLEEYLFEKRSVYEQKINLKPDEMEKLMALINDNLKPENKKYRYDFFYDDCSTRIRDIIEKSIGSKLQYPTAETRDQPTFRDKVGEYQQPYPWLKFGIDLIMGTPGERKASLRDRMFLPIDLQRGLSEAVVNRDGKMVPLLQNPDLLVQFDAPVIRHRFYTTPIFLFSALLILIVICLSVYKGRILNKTVDIVLFSLFSILSALMIFFNFFTDHVQMQRNLNIIWLSPFLFMCLAAIILNREWHIWFRIVFFLCIISFIIQIILPHGFNTAFIPLLLLLIVRSSARAGFSWNPLSVDTF